MFWNQSLEWRNITGESERLPVILDHINGNSSDNTPSNLRYLCPNCDSQLSDTRGGANKGRIKIYDENNYLIVNRNGTKGYHIFGSGGAVAGGSAKISSGHKKVENTPTNDG